MFKMYAKVFVSPPKTVNSPGSAACFQVLISLKMFGGRPIECWLPAEYKSSWEDYTGDQASCSFSNND